MNRKIIFINIIIFFHTHHVLSMETKEPAYVTIHTAADDGDDDKSNIPLPDMPTVMRHLYYAISRCATDDVTQILSKYKIHSKTYNRLPEALRNELKYGPFWHAFFLALDEKDPLQEKRYQILGKLAQYGLQAQEYMEVKEAHGFKLTPAHYAAFLGDIKMVKYLVAIIKIYSIHELTALDTLPPLTPIFFSGSVEMAKYFIDCSQSAWGYYRSSGQWKPIYASDYVRDPNVAKYLKKYEPERSCF